MKKDAAEALTKEQLKFNQKIDVITGERDALSQRVVSLEEELRLARDQIVKEKVVREELENANVALKRTTIELSENLVQMETARESMSQSLIVTTTENEVLKVSLASVPSKESILSEYCASDAYKRSIVEARVAAVDAYKCSEEFEEELRGAVERGIAGFRGSVEFAEELARIRDGAISDYQKGASFKEAVGVEAGKLSKRVVDCCREFLKDDMQRPTQEFGEFFMSFVRRQRTNMASGCSPGGSGTRSSTT